MSTLVVTGLNWFVLCVRRLWVALFAVLGADVFAVMGLLARPLDVGVINLQILCNIAFIGEYGRRYFALERIGRV